MLNLLVMMMRRHIQVADNMRNMRIAVASIIIVLIVVVVVLGVVVAPG